MNNGMHMSLSILVSSGYMPRSGIVGPYGGFFPSFLKESTDCLPQQLCQFPFPPTVQEHSISSTPSPAFIVCKLFDLGHSDGCEMVPHCASSLSVFLFLCYMYVTISSTYYSFACFFYNLRKQYVICFITKLDFLHSTLLLWLILIQLDSVH